MPVKFLSPGFGKFSLKEPNKSTRFHNKHNKQDFFSKLFQTWFEMEIRQMKKRLTSAICVTCRISICFIWLHHNTSTWGSTRPNANGDEFKSKKFNTSCLEASRCVIPNRHKRSCSTVRFCLSKTSPYVSLDQIIQITSVNTYDNECVSLKEYLVKT